jgi:molybdopterin converting factor subunit 1
MLLRVHLFARLRDEIGSSVIELDLTEQASIAELRAELLRRYPNIVKLLLSCRVAVNHEFADDSQLLQASDELALIPPVSGG